MSAKPTWQIIVDDVMKGLAQLKDESFQMCITSPPYLWLRDYGIDGQIGLEKSPDEFIQKLVEVFREVRRVLRKDGTCWINMGDKYSTGGKGGGGAFMKARREGSWKMQSTLNGWQSAPPGYKAKELMGIPWLLAFALQKDGWYLRTEIIWEKKNSMPESIDDRPSRCHEYIFLLSKRPKYFYDKEAVKQPTSATSHARAGRYIKAGDGVNPKAKAYFKEPGKSSRIHTVRDVAHSHKTPRPRSNESYSAAIVGLSTKRNLRSVWSINASGYKGAHFATFPPKLALLPILAGTSAHGCCAACGAPYKRILANGKADLAHQVLCGGDRNGNYNGQATKEFELAGAQNASDVKRRILAGMVEKITVGWEKTCHKKCECTEVVPCTVLDCFSGSGTTLAVAFENGRSSVGIELNPEYAELSRERLRSITPLLFNK